MRLHSPSMSELHAFMTAARLGSFTLAAEALCVTQGAVSRAIARLEAHFGQPLMRRNAHGQTLTEPAASSTTAAWRRCRPSRHSAPNCAPTTAACG